MKIINITHKADEERKRVIKEVIKIMKNSNGCFLFASNEHTIYSDLSAEEALWYLEMMKRDLFEEECDDE